MKTMLLCIAAIAGLLIAGAKSSNYNTVRMIGAPSPGAVTDTFTEPMVTKTNIINTNAK
jgi:hypothetical protein